MEVKPDVKILLVDDREENLLTLETILPNEEYSFVKAGSGREALKVLLKDQDFHLIIMDVVMPGMDGFETAELIYSREKLQNVPIIFLTAMDVEENIYKGYKAGAIDYISKPFIPELLRAKVRAFVDLSLKNKKLIAQEEKLRKINQKLENEIQERRASEAQVRSLNQDLEQKLEELQSLDAFAYSVSHDLMSPLNNIEGLSSMLLTKFDANLDEKAKKVVNLIQDSAHKMSDLIKGLLLFSRQANTEIVKTELNMNELVTVVLEEMGSYHSLEKFNIEVAELPTVEGDGNMLKQVWVNFISNAIKYSEKKTAPHIQVGVREENEGLTFFVKDNGAGFDMKNYDKLFGVFQRLHKSSEFKGTGIGLSIVKRIVERHGGKVWAESILGQGATFYFSMTAVAIRQ